jgi:Zn-dependent peptidase ImmA (M78 family)/transcriptional regulator with XRE-family HTH domain
MANQIYRLTEARELRGLSVMELAEKLGVTRQAIYQYESGTVRPSNDTLQEIVETLGFPYSFFEQPHVGLQIEERPIFFRDMKSNLERNRKLAKRWLQLLYERVLEYEKLLTLPVVNIPSISIGNFRELQMEEIDSITERVRRAWGLGDGPISNLSLLLENNGYIIAHKDVLSDKLDACSMIFGGRPCILVNTHKRTCSRILANLAHEVGHCVLHQDVEIGEISNSKTLAIIEAQAWRFATSFLMPPSIFANEVGYPSINQFIYMKKRWRTSIALMIMHSQSLGIISEERKQFFFRELSRNGLLKHEPLDDELKIESANLLLDCEKAIYDNGLTTKDALLQESCLDAKDYQELIAAPADYFQPQFKKPQLRLIST